MEVGSILAGRYRVGEMLGRGGMGVVVKATHMQLGTPVAIKLLRREATDEPDLVARFLREARSAARLRGEHVCRVTDFGTAEDGTPFMVMEYLEGEDLQTIVDANGPLDPKLVATYMLQACIGVAEAHALGIVHRDLKPGNLFVVKQPDGRRSIKLLDFGIAKSCDIDGSLTNTSKAMGSPAYMSPEQLKSSTSVDARADVWALGVTMFELLTEKRPFDGDTPYELAIAIANEPAVRLPETVPSEIAAVVMHCLEKDRDRRYADVGELAAALAPLVKNGRDLAIQVKAALTPGNSTGAVRALAAESPATATTLRAASGAVTAIPQRSRTRFVLPLVMLVIAVAATLGVIMFAGKKPDDVATPAAAPSPPPPISIDAAMPAIEVDAMVVESAPAIDAAPDLVETAPPVDAAEPAKTPKKKPKKSTKPKDFSNSRY